MWTPTPDEQLKDELQAALARPHASHVSPPRPVPLAAGERAAGARSAVGWLWGRMRTADRTWLGLATVWTSTFFQGAEQGGYPATDLRLRD